MQSSGGSKEIKKEKPDKGEQQVRTDYALAQDQLRKQLAKTDLPKPVFSNPATAPISDLIREIAFYQKQLAKHRKPNTAPAAK